MYQTLYRSYRPQDFSQVIGQDQVVKVLLAALAKDRVAHAYLFTGPRGTGKTSVARLLAKAVNCVATSADHAPICNQCSACQAITQGNSLDVVEIDAASNRGIDDIRALRERIQFPPQELKQKVYIIDEVHMLTAEAFNALLKTLEEPPEYAMFILATTEPHRVPITIQSRCQRLDFYRATEEQLQVNLERVLKQEQLRVEPAALVIITELAEGSFRDSLTLLERVAHEEQPVTAERVRSLLGLGDDQMVRKLIQALLAADRLSAFQLLDQAVTKGVHPPYLAQSVVRNLRRLMYVQLKAVTASDANEQQLADQAQLTEWRRLLQFWQQATVDSKRSPFPFLPLEIAVAKWMELKPDVSVAEVIAESAAESVAKSKAKSGDTESTVKPSTVKPAEPKEEPEVELADITLDAKQWDQVLSILINHNHSLTKLLQQAAVGKVKQDQLPIYVQYQFHAETLKQKTNYDALAKALEQVTKRNIVPVFEIGAPKTDQPLIKRQVSSIGNTNDEDLTTSVNEMFN